MAELDLKNSCQEMLAYTLVKAIEDLTARLGPYDSNEWQMQNLKKVKFEHPLGKTPFGDYFEE